MSRPFDYVDDKKLDLSLKEHRDTVIKRNKLLEKKLQDGICLYNDQNVTTKIIVRVNLECYVCGTLIEEDSSTDDAGYFRLEKNIPKLKCDCCKTIYDFVLRLNEVAFKNSQNFKLITNENRYKTNIK